MFFVETIEINNYRAISALDLHFHNAQPIVFIGNNGSGKSSILSALNIALAHFTARLRNPKSPGPVIDQLDIKNGSAFSDISIGINTAFGPFEWTIIKYRKGFSRDRDSDYVFLRQVVDGFQKRLTSNEAGLPLIAYYPTNRAVLDIPLRVRGEHHFDPIDAYDSSFGGIGLNFRLFFEWFRKQEDLENELRLDDPHYRDGQLEAVRQAIILFDGRYASPRVRRNPLRMTLTKRVGEVVSELWINQLSDGEKCVIAMIGDIARRLSLANPASENPLIGEGIILIDEIELHLHPNWQRRIIKALVIDIFPNCQFIISTHSPLVLSELESGHVYSLASSPSDIGPIIRELDRWFGRDSNRLLEDVMQDADRPLDIKKSISQMFQLIEDGDLLGAHSVLDELSLRIGNDDPSFARASILMRRKELLGR